MCSRVFIGVSMLLLSVVKSLRMRSFPLHLSSITLAMSSSSLSPPLTTTTDTCAPNTSKLIKLRELMLQENIDALIVPTEDPHMSEYTSDYFNRREYISGFTGSAGTVVVTQSSALLFTDGRYHNQAEKELSPEWTLMKVGVKGILNYPEHLSSTLSSSQSIGIDPLVHSAALINKIKSSVEAKNITIKSLSTNLIDTLWTTRPLPPSGKIRVHPMEYAGKSVEDKLADVRRVLNENKAYGIVLSSLDEIMWLFNIRGADVPCNPVAISYATITLTDAVLYVDGAKLSYELISHLNSNQITIDSYENILDGIAYSLKKGMMAVDSRTINYGVYSNIPADQRIDMPSPIILMKAIKNEIELQGMRNSHLRDGAAVVEFLCGLEKKIHSGLKVTEYGIDIDLTLSRSMQKEGYFIERSFPTIAGVNSNGAVIHYRAAQETCLEMTQKDMLLLDSGGQYIDGTTDVTRTIHFGVPSDIQKEMFTRVLKGHIALDSKVFPAGTAGCQLDSHAREFLWNIGKDYIHGTGHGVGAALNVHEGPHRISRVIDTQPLVAGMIVSNEPGYYENGEYGIRIENLLEVVNATTLGEYGGRPFLGFKKLTYIPISKNLMKTELLTTIERDWINNYHIQVKELISPLLKSEETKKWLEKNTSPL